MSINPDLQNILMLKSGQLSFYSPSFKYQFHVSQQISASSALFCNQKGHSFPHAAAWAAAVKLFVRLGHEPYCKLISKKRKEVRWRRAENHPARPTIFLPPGTTELRTPIQSEYPVGSRIVSIQWLFTSTPDLLCIEHEKKPGIQGVRQQRIREEVTKSEMKCHCGKNYQSMHPGKIDVDYLKQLCRLDGVLLDLCCNCSHCSCFVNP